MWMCLFCFVLLSYLVNVFFYASCVVWCLLTCSMFRRNWWRDWISGMNIYVCMEWKRKIIFLRHALWMRTFFVHDNKVLQLTIKRGKNNPRMKHNLHVDHQWVVLFRIPWRISSNKLEGWWSMLVWCPRRRWENSFWIATREIPTL
jgi:hypothetical protein